MKKIKACKSNNYAYNPALRKYALALRNNMTKAEACLWKHALKARQMRGYIFCRQRPVLNYIADFLCKDLMLIIEVDGFSHFLDETMRKDERKEMKLREAGFTVLRFSDDEVLNDIGNVIREIEYWIDSNSS